jgi:hypothetical protein
MRPKRTKAERLREREQRARRAVSDLESSAVLRDGGLVAELNPAVLLGTALTAAPAKQISIEGSAGDPLVFERRRLREARKALLRPFEDLRVWVDVDGLHFRWRAGYGGLNIPALSKASDDRFTVRVTGLRIEVREAA